MAITARCVTLYGPERPCVDLVRLSLPYRSLPGAVPNDTESDFSRADVGRQHRIFPHGISESRLDSMVGYYHLLAEAARIPGLFPGATKPPFESDSVFIPWGSRAVPPRFSGVTVSGGRGRTASGHARKPRRNCAASPGDENTVTFKWRFCGSWK